MNYLEAVAKIKSKVTTREDAINTIKDCFGWFSWFVDFQDYKEECVPNISDMSDEELVEIARQQLLIDNEEYLSYLLQEEYA